MLMNQGFHFIASAGWYPDFFSVNIDHIGTSSSPKEFSSALFSTPFSLKAHGSTIVTLNVTPLFAMTPFDILGDICSLNASAVFPSTPLLTFEI
jgi:hypothetical protein